MVRLFHPDGRQTRAAQHLPNTRAEFVAWFKAKRSTARSARFVRPDHCSGERNGLARRASAGTYPELAQQGT